MWGGPCPILDRLSLGARYLVQTRSVMSQLHLQLPFAEEAYIGQALADHPSRLRKNESINIKLNYFLIHGRAKISAEKHRL
jgi:hypothetical protein